MSQHEKLEARRLIESSGLSISSALKRLGVARSTYYRWRQKFRTLGVLGLQDNKPHRLWTWNQLLAVLVVFLNALQWVCGTLR